MTDALIILVEEFIGHNDPDHSHEKFIEQIQQLNEARALLIRQIRGRSISLSFERETTMVTIATVKTKCPDSSMLDTLYSHGLIGWQSKDGTERRERRKDSYGSYIKQVNKDHIAGFMLAHGHTADKIKKMTDWLEYDTDLLD